MSEKVKDMPVENQLPFNIHIQYLKDLSFENPNPLAHLTSTDQIQPEIGINIQVNAHHITEKMFEVILEIKTDAKRKDDIMFICQVQYAAILSLVNENEPEENIKKILLVSCPHFIFPFARNIVADLTRDSGFPPLMLQPVDFEALNKGQNKKDDKKSTDAEEKKHLN